MVDPTGAGGALAIEAVEWTTGDGDRLTVRIRGRWRRRRPDWRGQPLLVIEANAQRHRFTAIPEPPSLAGAPPGRWEMTFSVPAAMAPHLGGRIWLQLGLALVPLPSPALPVAAGEPPAGPQPVDPETLSDRRVRTAELAARRARERQAEAEALLTDMTIRAGQLEDELERALREPERLRALLAERDQQRRAAEQRAHAERALRLELHEGGELRSRDRRLIEAGELAEAEARVRELERQLRALKRRARQAATAARAPFDLSGEVVVAAASAPVAAVTRADERVAAAAVELRALEAERRLLDSRMIAGRTTPPPPTGDREPDGSELATVLAEIRTEFEQLTTIAEREHVGRVAAEERTAELERALRERELRSARVSDAVHELRGLLDQVRGERGVASAPAAAGEADPDPFDAARSRLRAMAPAESEAEAVWPTEAAPVLAGVAWLKDAFARLTARDPSAAGRLLVSLLPAQGAVHAAAIAYDLVLSDGLAIQVTLGEPPARAAITTAECPRDLAEVAFRVTGDHAALARLVNAGQPRRLLRGGRARVAGARRELRALVELVRSPLSLEELFDAGVRLEPELTFMLAAAMVEPAWTVGQRFTIAHLEGSESGPATYLNVRRGEPLIVTAAPPLGPMAATIVSRGESLLAMLAGKPDVEASISGDRGQLLGLLGWLERAQRG
jgi:hypothetical protein